MTSTPCRDPPKTELLSVEEWLMVNVINHNTALQVHTKYGQFAQSIVRNAMRNGFRDHRAISSVKFPSISDGSVSRWLKRPLSGSMGAVPRERGGAATQEREG